MPKRRKGLAKDLQGIASRLGAAGSIKETDVALMGAAASRLASGDVEACTRALDATDDNVQDSIPDELWECLAVMGYPTRR